MQGTFSLIRHLFGAMLKGFFFTDLVAAIACAAVLFVTEPSHQVTLDTSTAFGLVIAFLAGIVGAAMALMYRLSHVDGIHHTVQHYSEQRAAQRQQRSSAR